jgi:TolA-binding protein
MKKVKIHTVIFIFLISIFTVAPITASSEEPGEAKPSEETKEKLSPADSEAKAYELFNEILTLTETSDTKTVLPQIETLYFKIIREYPETALAQESYWRLISIYVDRSIPPGYEKAETLYFEFLKKYPESVIKNMIEDTLSKSYYKNGKWDKLLKLSLPAVNEFKEKGKLSNPNLMFMYAEAKFNLGDLIEAERAYKIVIELFPTSSKAAASKRRLEEIKKTKAKADSD